MAELETTDLERLFLHDLHLALGARMVAFAGYQMPVQYSAGVMAEHLHTRAAAGLFDVSHMGQVILRPREGMERLALALEALMPVDVLALPAGRQRYGLLTDTGGGILDDLMVANRGDHLLLVVNAARKRDDIAHLAASLGNAAELVPVTDRALLALQGPAAAAALARLVPGVARMRFLDVAVLPWSGAELWLSRSGYTGEDGFEISVPAAAVLQLAQTLLAMPEVRPVGLGARDSLRLEAGLPLYGQDIDAGTSPVEAGLGWSIQKSRRAGGARQGGFPGAARILAELADAPSRHRVGLRPDGRAPMREGTELSHAGGPVGRVTSGGYGPTVGAPVAMGYVPAALAGQGTALTGMVRGKPLPVTVAPLPFIPTNYQR